MVTGVGGAAVVVVTGAAVVTVVAGGGEVVVGGDDVVVDGGVVAVVVGEAVVVVVSGTVVVVVEAVVSLVDGVSPVKPFDAASKTSEVFSPSALTVPTAIRATRMTSMATSTKAAPRSDLCTGGLSVEFRPERTS